MKKILFVCYGNQCRSPMAEYFFNDYIEELKLDEEFRAESAGTLPGIGGQPVFVSARKKLEESGIDCSGHQARYLVWGDYDRFDLLICFDESTVERVRRITEEYEENLPEDKRKIRKLLDFTYRKGEDISDPMVTGDYETAWKDIVYGCRGLIEYLMAEEAKKSGIQIESTTADPITEKDVFLGSDNSGEYDFWEFIEYCNREKPELKRAVEIICKMLDAENIPVKYIGEHIHKEFDGIEVEFKKKFLRDFDAGLAVEYRITYAVPDYEDWGLSAHVHMPLKRYEWLRTERNPGWQRAAKRIIREMKEELGCSAWYEGAVFNDKNRTWNISITVDKSKINTPDDLAVYYHSLRDGVVELIKKLRGGRSFPRNLRVDGKAEISFFVAFDMEIIFDYLDKEMPTVRWEDCDREEYDPDTRWR